MPVDGTWRVQAGSALVTATSSFTASLPNPTTDSSTLLLFVGTAGSGTVSLQSSSSFDPPWFLDAVHASALYVYRRDSQPAGETSWVIPCTAVSNSYYWRVEEWGGLSSVGQPDANGPVTGTATPATNANFTDLSSSITADVADFAALAAWRASTTGSIVWPAAHSYGAGKFDGPSSWNEVAFLASGDGTGASDFILAIAEAYPGAAGNVAAALNFDTTGGGALPNTVQAWAGCYQPAAAASPAGVLAVAAS